jgi:hypothetical protein
VRKRRPCVFMSVSWREGAGWSLVRIRGRHRVSRRSPTRARPRSWLPVRPQTRAYH